MEWTKHKPTQDGYYWMKRGEGAKPEVMEIFGGAAQEADVFVELDDAAYEHALWYGPLTAPAESPFAPGLRALGFKQPPGGPAAVTIDLQQVPAASPRCKTCAHWRVLKNPVAEDMCNPVDQDTSSPCSAALRCACAFTRRRLSTSRRWSATDSASRMRPTIWPCWPPPKNSGVFGTSPSRTLRVSNCGTTRNFCGTTALFAIVPVARNAGLVPRPGIEPGRRNYPAADFKS